MSDSNIAVPAAPPAVQGTVILAREVDDESAVILDELGKLQHWCVLHMALGVAGAIQAADLVQRTRILIIERCKK